MPQEDAPLSSSAELAEDAIELIKRFRDELQSDDLREKVRRLIPVFNKVRDIGKSLLPLHSADGARERILAYFRKFPGMPIDGDELMVVSGIGEWARRVRELRVEHGWWIHSGLTLAEIAAEEGSESDAPVLRPDQYILAREDQDRDAAFRWNMLNEIRRMNSSVRDKILEFFRRNAQKPITGDELKYLAKERKEWARRVRELRTEYGWPIATRMSGRPDLPVGVYVLEEDRQSPPHDRHIPDPVRVQVLNRDGFKCTSCGWKREMMSPGDPRKLIELHHVTAHKDRGANSAENLISLCNVCHDDVHRRASNVS